ncbi:DUF2380 domain-containing protein [Candidatus Neomarinimicrobiota bacterium]
MKSLLRSCHSILTLLIIWAVLGASPVSAQNIPVAILDFEANGISQTEVIALTDRLRNELFRLGEFEVVERGLMEDILAEQDFQMSGCTSNECLVEVGRLIGAQQVIGGRISKIGTMFTVSARMVAVETGKVLAVSDYDLRGGLEEMLTTGMAQVAMIIVGGEEVDLSEGPITEVVETGAESKPESHSQVISAPNPVSDQAIRTWSVSAGLGSSRCANLVAVTKDFIIWRGFSFFISAGYGPQMIGAGFSYQNNYHQGGFTASASFGTSPDQMAAYVLVGRRWVLRPRLFLFTGLGLLGSPLHGETVTTEALPVISVETRL